MVDQPEKEHPKRGRHLVIDHSEVVSNESCTGLTSDLCIEVISEQHLGVET